MLVFVITRYGEPALSFPWEIWVLLIQENVHLVWMDGHY